MYTLDNCSSSEGCPKVLILPGASALLVSGFKSTAVNATKEFIEAKGKVCLEQKAAISPMKSPTK